MRYQSYPGRKDDYFTKALFKAERYYDFLTLSGCSSKVAETSQYSGFMSDYSDLQGVETSSGREAKSYVPPDGEQTSWLHISNGSVACVRKRDASNPTFSLNSALCNFSFFASVISYRPPLRTMNVNCCLKSLLHYTDHCSCNLHTRLRTVNYLAPTSPMTIRRAKCKRVKP